jgi:hypothetical protein
MHQMLNYNTCYIGRANKIPLRFNRDSSTYDKNKHLLIVEGLSIDSNWLRKVGLEDFSVDFHYCYIDGGGTTEHQKNCDWQFKYCKFAEGFYHSNYKPYDLSHTLSVNLNDNKYYGYKAVYIKKKSELPTIGILKLEIPFNAEIRNGNSKKMRTSRATPIKLMNLRFEELNPDDYCIYSCFHHEILYYNIGQEIVIDDFDLSHRICSTGIHFFSTIPKVLAYLEDNRLINFLDGSNATTF